MKTIARAGLVAVMVGTSVVLSVAGAGAATLTFVDKVDPNPDRLISFGVDESYTFSHSLIADQDGAGSFWSGTYGFNPLTDAISSVSLTLNFKDESTDTAAESVALTFDAQPFGTHVITSGGAIYGVTFNSGFGTLLNDGVLNVTLQNAGTTSGNQDNRSDFLFLDSTLTVRVDRTETQPPTTPAVPEPTSLALVALGLTALVARRRRVA